MIRTPAALASLAALAVAFAACATQPAKKSAAAKSPSAAKVASAQAAPAAPASAKPAAAAVVKAEGPLKHIWGTVTAVDAAAGTLAIKDHSGRAHTYRLASDVKLTKGGANAAIHAGDLKVGERVTVMHGGDVAASVHVNVIGQAASSVAKSN